MKLSKSSRLIRDYGESELQKIYLETKEKVYPVSYFGLVNTIERIQPNENNRWLKLMPNSTDDYDMVGHIDEEYFINNGYRKRNIISKIDFERFPDYSLKIYYTPFELFEKNFEYGDEEITVQYFPGYIGAVEFREEDKENFDIYNLSISIQPGAIKEERIRQTLSTYCLLCEKDKETADKFREIYRDISLRSLDRRLELYPEKKMQIDENKWIESLHDSMRDIEKERNLLKYSLKGKYKKKAKTSEEEFLIEQYFETIIDSLDEIIGVYKNMNTIRFYTFF